MITEGSTKSENTKEAPFYTHASMTADLDSWCVSKRVSRPAASSQGSAAAMSVC